MQINHEELISDPAKVIEEIHRTVDMSSSPVDRIRTCSESSEGESGGLGIRPAGVSYDVEGKFSYNQVGSRIVTQKIISCSGCRSCRGS